MGISQYTVHAYLGVNSVTLPLAIDELLMKVEIYDNYYDCIEERPVLDVC
jgi:hypothetical protein